MTVNTYDKVAVALNFLKDGHVIEAATLLDEVAQSRDVHSVMRRIIKAGAEENTEPVDPEPNNTSTEGMEVPEDPEDPTTEIDGELRR